MVWWLPPWGTCSASCFALVVSPWAFRDTKLPHTDRSPMKRACVLCLESFFSHYLCFFHSPNSASFHTLYLDRNFTHPWELLFLLLKLVFLVIYFPHHLQVLLLLLFNLFIISVALLRSYGTHFWLIRSTIWKYLWILKLPSGVCKDTFNDLFCFQVVYILDRELCLYKQQYLKDDCSNRGEGARPCALWPLYAL